MNALSRHRALAGALAAALVAGAIVAALATRPGSAGIAAGDLGGRPAPPIAGPDVLGGPPVSLSSLDRGHYVVVDFFASWCSACLEETPELEALVFSRHGGPAVRVLGVDIEDSAANAARFLKITGATFPAVADDGAIAEAYGVTSPPALVVVDPRGTVVGVSTVASPSAVQAIVEAASGRGGLA